MTKIIQVAMLAIIFATSLLATSAPANAQERWVGVFIPQQNILVDAFTRNKNADEYFMPLWNFYKQGRVQGAQSRVRLFLQTSGQQTTIFNGMVNGHKYVSVNRSDVKANTLLCVTVPWTIIAHQRVSGGERTMCERGVNRWFQKGRARTPEDAWGVIAIKPAGV